MAGAPFVAWMTKTTQPANNPLDNRCSRFPRSQHGKEQPQRIDIPLLEPYEEFREFRNASSRTDGPAQIAALMNFEVGDILTRIFSSQTTERGMGECVFLGTRIRG